MIFGYARVSTSDQNISTQVTLLKENGCEKIYTDIASGVREDRKGLNEMLAFLREGDIVIVYKTDRIFRSMKNMIDLIEVFNQKKVSFKSLTEPAFDTTSRKRNKHLGRPAGVSQEILEKYQFALHLYKNKNISIDKACKQAKISKTSFYRIENLKK